MIKNQRLPNRSELAPQIMNAIALQIVYRVLNHTPAVGSPSFVATWVEMIPMAGTIQNEI